MGGGKSLSMSLVPPKNDPQAILNSVEWFYDLYKDYVDGVLDTSFSMPKDAAEWYVEATINRANILLEEVSEHYTTYDTLEMGYEFLNNENIEVEDVFYLMTEIQDGIDNLESEGKLILPYSSVSFVEATTAVVNVSYGLGIQLFTQGDFTAGDDQSCDGTIPFDARHVIEMNVFSHYFPTYTPGQFGTFLTGFFDMDGWVAEGPLSNDDYCGEIYFVNTNVSFLCSGITPPSRSTLGRREDCIPASELTDYVNGGIRYVQDENINDDDFVAFLNPGIERTGGGLNFYHHYGVQYGVLVIGPISL